LQNALNPTANSVVPNTTDFLKSQFSCSLILLLEIRRDLKTMPVSFKKIFEKSLTAASKQIVFYNILIESFFNRSCLSNTVHGYDTHDWHGLNNNFQNKGYKIYLDTSKTCLVFANTFKYVRMRLYLRIEW